MSRMRSGPTTMESKYLSQDSISNEHAENVNEEILEDNEKIELIN
jgi:hypothetical protein